jgi:hypothetical protein
VSLPSADYDPSIFRLETLTMKMITALLLYQENEPGSG